LVWNVDSSLAFFPNLIASIIGLPLEKRPGNAPGLSEQQWRKAYFCCSLGLSAGFGGLPWVCCCGVAGVAGFCGSDAETGTVVMEKFFHEKN
jgi:hypothetical protein